MATDIVIPEVGESVTSGVLAAWVKADGEYVERDEQVAELETDKITMELLAPAAGVLKHTAAEGDTVDVGAVVGSVDESAAKPAGAAAPQAAAAGGTAVADPPKTETKQESAAPAPAAAPGGASGGAPQNGSPRQPTLDRGDAHATPLARKLASENGIDIRNVVGTGAGGRIREKDVLAAVQAGGDPGETSVAAQPQRQVSVDRMSPMRQRIASRLVEAQQTAAMLTTFNEVDMGPVMDLRKRHKEAFAERHGINLGFMSFFVKAVCGALKAFPQINSYIVADEDGKPAVQGHDFCDVAIAVSSPKGLVVPVLRDAQALSFAGIESGIKDFAVRAKAGKLGLDEMTGGTFTITNGGVFGSLMSTPILNPPQSAILGMHAIKKRPMEYPEGSGQVAVRPMMYLALSYDHRIVDGAGAVQFLVHIKNAIEQPERLMLEL